MDPQSPRDDQLWKLARKRAEFKKNLWSYLIINPFNGASGISPREDLRLTWHSIPFVGNARLGWK